MEQSWPAALQSLTEKLSADNLPHQVRSCRSLEQKIEKVLSQISVCKKISGWLSLCGETKYSKSATTADRVREQGNIKFSAGDNNGALKLYTESVICAPLGPALGLALGNRSAALYHLGQYEAASQDIELALENKFPRNIAYKLHLRQAQCNIRLGQYHKVERELERCRAGLEHCKLTDLRKLAVLKDITALSQEITRLQQTQTSPEVGEAEVSALTWSEDIPGGSEKLKLETSGDKTRGRFVTASQDIEAGEILYRESPYSCVLLPPFYSSHCQHCLASLAAPLACRACTQTRYCGRECRDLAWPEHKFECGRLETLHSVGIGHLAYRTVLKVGRDHLLSVRGKVRAGTYTVTRGDQYSSVYNLQHHLDRLSDHELFQYTLTAALLVTLLVKNTAFLTPEREIPGLSMIHMKPPQPGHTVSDDILYYIGALILRHIVQLVSNAHAVTEVHHSEDDTVEQVRLATAIYTSVSLLNHSCVPMIVNNFRGSELTVRATRAVTAGEEVTNCYGPHHRRHEYSDRQRMLKEQYYFRCNCSACADTADRKFFQRFRARRCVKCEGPVVEAECLDCDNGVAVSEPETEDVDSSSDDLNMLKQTERGQARTLYRHHESLAAVRDKIAMLEVDRGQFGSALSRLRLGVEYTTARYGEHSIELGHELLKLSDVLLARLQTEGGDPGQLVSVLRQAATIFTTQHGDNSRNATEIKQKLAYFGAD